MSDMASFSPPLSPLYTRLAVFSVTLRTESRGRCVTENFGGMQACAC